MNIVYVGMSADLIHHGHINILENASKYGKVIVGLLTDEAINSYKRQPIITYNYRKKILKSIRYVDDIIEQRTLDYTDNLEKIRPQYVIHGDDWKKGPQKETRQKVINLLKKWDGKLIEISYTQNISTTTIIKRINNNNNLINKIKVKLDSIYIGDNYPTQIIGEIGQNHNGCIENAKKLIDMCKNCGITFVKFQKRDIKTEFTKEGYNRPYINSNSFGKIYGKHREFLELTKDQHKELKKYANDSGLIYFCTPCDIPSLRIMEEIGCPFYKVASRDITNIPLLKELGKLNKTVIISTGIAEYEDIDNALEALNLPIDKVVILQCTSQYPCPPKNCNLNVITTLKKKYKNIIGFSDHTDGILAATVSCLLGANIIEKHITLDRCMKGTDHPGSFEFIGLQKLYKYINTIPIMLGSFEKKVEDNVLSAKNKLMKSITSKTYINKGTIFTEDMFCLKCPGNGLLWKEKNKIIGKKANRDIEEDKTLLIEWFE